MYKRLLSVTFLSMLFAGQCAFAETIRLMHMILHEPVDNILNDFRQKKSIDVESIVIDVNDINGYMMRALQEDNLPDAALFPADKIGLPGMNYAVIPEDWINRDVATTYYETTRLDGEIRGIPVYGGNHLMLYYNKKYVKKPATNWEEVFQQAPSIRAQGVEVIGWSFGEMYWLVGFLGAFGGWPISGDQISIDTPEIQQGLTYYKSLADRGLIDPSCTYDCAAQRFYQGEFAYAINGDWAYLNASKALKDDFGVSMIPNVGERRVTPMFSTIALVFPNDSLNGPKQAALKELAKYFQSRDIQLRSYEELGRFPVHRGVIRKLQDSAEQNTQMALKQLDVAQPMTASPLMTRMWTGLSRWFPLFMTGKVPVEQITQKMQKTATGR